MDNYLPPSTLDRIFDDQSKLKLDDLVANTLPEYSYRIESYEIYLKKYKNYDQIYQEFLINNISKSFPETDIFNDTYILLIKKDNNLLGIVCFLDHEFISEFYRLKGFTNDSQEEIKPNFVYVYNLLIDSYYRNQGYSYFILEILEKYLKENNKSGINVKINDQNHLSKHIFLKKNFIKVKNKNPNIGSDNYMKWIKQ